MSRTFGHAVMPYRKGDSLCQTCLYCEEPNAYRIRYCYITGMKGRSTFNDRFVCVEHARLFALKHKLEMPGRPNET